MTALTSWTNLPPTRLGQWTGARPGDEDAHVVERNVLEGVSDADQQFQDLFRLARLMALVVGPKDFLGKGIDRDSFHGGGPNVDAEDEVIASEASA